MAYPVRSQILNQNPEQLAQDDPAQPRAFNEGVNQTSKVIEFSENYVGTRKMEGLLADTYLILIGIAGAGLVIWAIAYSIM